MQPLIKTLLVWIALTCTVGCKGEVDLEATGGFVLTIELAEAGGDANAATQDVARILEDRLRSIDSDRLHHVTVLENGQIEVAVSVPREIRDWVRELESTWDTLREARISPMLVMFAVWVDDPPYELQELIGRHPAHAATIRRFGKLLERHERTSLQDPESAANAIRRMGRLSIRIAPTASGLGLSREDADFNERLEALAEGPEFGWLPLQNPHDWLSATSLRGAPDAGIDQVIEDLRLRDLLVRPVGDSVEMLVSNRPGEHILFQPEDFKRDGVEITEDRRERPALRVSFASTGAGQLKAMTSAHVGEQMAILHDDTVLIAAEIQSMLVDHLLLRGNFQPGELEELEDLLSHPLSVPVEVVDVRIIEPADEVSGNSSGD